MAPKMRFMCDHEGCGRTFTKKFNLQTHLRVHSGETPFVCEVKGCNRKFRWQSSLVSHIQTHSRPTTTKGNKEAAPAAKPTQVEPTASLSELTWTDCGSLYEPLTPTATTSKEPFEPCITEENSISVPSVAHQLDIAQLPLENLCELWDLYQFPEVPNSSGSTVSAEQRDGGGDYWNLAFDMDETREPREYEIAIF